MSDKQIFARMAEYCGYDSEISDNDDNSFKSNETQLLYDLIQSDTTLVLDKYMTIDHIVPVFMVNKHRFVSELYQNGAVQHEYSDENIERIISEDIEKTFCLFIGSWGLK